MPAACLETPRRRPTSAAVAPKVPVPDARLEAARAFAVRVLDTAGDPGEAALGEFLGIGAYTLSTFANRLTGAPVDEPPSAFA